MASPQSLLSKTLHSITVTKIRELEKQRTAYDARKKSILEKADAEPDDVRARLAILHREMAVKPPLISFKDGDAWLTYGNISKWLAQAEYDPALPERKLLEGEKWLRDTLDRGSRKLDLAHLYSRLLTEWIEGPDAAEAPFDDLDASTNGSSDSETFEVVQDAQKARLEQQRDKFARVVLEPLETDEAAIEQFLAGLFEGDSGDKALKSLREGIQRKGEFMLGSTFCLDDKSLSLCINALLANSLPNAEKKASLTEFLKDDAVLAEIRDVLNMRLRDIKNWDWDLGDGGITVVPRQSLNGQWRVMMDEDVLQSLLGHFIGITWAIHLKEGLTSTRLRTGLWKQYTGLPAGDQLKRRYYEDGRIDSSGSLAEERLDQYRKDFFMSTLPHSMSDNAGQYDNDAYDDDDNGEPSIGEEKKSPRDTKQRLLRTLTTEIVVRRSLEGEVAVVQSDFQWFATGIAHTTVFAILRFLGFQDEWIQFFKKFLEPPLDMLNGSPVQRRKRGLPMAHIVEKLLGELILYFMDLAVAQNSGMILYRFHDDLWLVGPPQACAASWKTMEQFARIMGLEFNESKTGSVYLTQDDRPQKLEVVEMLPKGPVVMDFLVLDPTVGRWVVDRQHVQQHATRLRKQLLSSSSALEFVKIHNSFLGRFVASAFGEPAHCLGRQHVDEILQTHQEIQKSLFDGAPVTQHIKRMVLERSGMDDIPDCFIFLPEELGGLGLKNPFIPLLLQRDDICVDPAERMREFHKLERNKYSAAKKRFDLLTDKERRTRYKAVFGEDDAEVTPVLSWTNAQSFPSFQEFTKYREFDRRYLYDVYRNLLEKPAHHGVDKTAVLDHAIASRKLQGKPLESLQGVSSKEAFWTVQYFADGLMTEFGGLEVVDTALLPMGVLKALKSRKANWQMVL